MKKLIPRQTKTQYLLNMQINVIEQLYLLLTKAYQENQLKNKQLMKDLKTRKDINKLVNIFYSKIRKDELLGPIFNSHIPEEQWEAHLSKLTDFWETNLFGKRIFKGNPTSKHIEVDKNLKYTINQVHFGKWLELWLETINELYEGELATKAKESARRMAHGQFMSIWSNRPENQ